MDSKTVANINRLQSFKGEVGKWRDADSDDERQTRRTFINRHRRAVRELMVDAGAHKWIDVGGPEDVDNRDPLDLIFNPPEGVDIPMMISDMIDETIGVLTDRAEDQPEPSMVPLIASEPVLDLRYQGGRLELIDPPPESPLKLNTLRDELPDKFATVMKALVDLTGSVQRENNFLGGMLKQQLITMLKATVLELEAPQTDTSRLNATAKALKGVAVEAAKKGGADFIRGQLESASTGLADLAQWLWQQAAGS